MAGASEVADCHAAWMGGGIFQEWNSTTTLQDSSAVADCTCDYYQGGGVAATTASYKGEPYDVVCGESEKCLDYPQDVKNMFIMKGDSQIRRCYSAYDAGGIYSGQDARWAGSTYKKWSQGDIWRPDAIEVSMHDSSSIWECEAGRSGGGITVENGGLLIMNDDSQLTRCRGNAGGGLFVDTEGHATLLGHSKVSYNKAKYGGGVYVLQGTLSAQGHSSICHNHASYGGGVLATSLHDEFESTVELYLVVLVSEVMMLVLMAFFSCTWTVLSGSMETMLTLGEA